MNLTDYLIYIEPLLIIIVAVILGLISERLLLDYLYRLAKKTKWEGDSILVDALRGKVVYLSAIAASFIVVNNFAIFSGIKENAAKVLMVLLILVVTKAASQVAVGFVDLYTRDALPSTSLLTHSAQIIVYIVGLLMILDRLNISIAPMLTALGIGGFGVALALQGTLSNLFSGLQMLASKQVKVGDYVKLDSGEEGTIEDITWRNTLIRALPNNYIVIPNTKMGEAVITNYNRPQKEMSVLIQVGVSYTSDLEMVEKVTIETAEEVMRQVVGGVAGFEPFIRYHTFGDSSINFTVIIRAREFVDQYLVKHEFVKRLQKRYSQEGIEIPFPIRTVYMQKQEQTEASSSRSF